MIYYNKYLKYKNKYLKSKLNIKGGGDCTIIYGMSSQYEIHIINNLDELINIIKIMISKNYEFNLKPFRIFKIVLDDVIVLECFIYNDNFFFIELNNIIDFNNKTFYIIINNNVCEFDDNEFFISVRKKILNNTFRNSDVFDFYNSLFIEKLNESYKSCIIELLLIFPSLILCFFWYQKRTDLKMDEAQKKFCLELINNKSILIYCVINCKYMLPTDSISYLNDINKKDPEILKVFNKMSIFPDAT